jgi:Aldolase/RraA
MKAESLSRAFGELSTPLIADAALRLKIPVRICPPGIHPVTPNQRLAGPALPVRHFGSVDVFLEAMLNAQPGEVLVIDNGGRLDEGCIGDLTALEAQDCELAGIIVWARIATLQSCGRFVCPFSVMGCVLPGRNGWTLVILQRCVRHASGSFRSNQAILSSPTTMAVCLPLPRVPTSYFRLHTKSGDGNGVRRRRSNAGTRCENNCSLRNIWRSERPIRVIPFGNTCEK